MTKANRTEVKNLQGMGGFNEDFIERSHTA